MWEKENLEKKTLKRRKLEKNFLTFTSVRAYQKECSPHRPCEQSWKTTLGSGVEGTPSLLLFILHFFFTLNFIIIYNIILIYYYYFWRRIAYSKNHSKWILPALVSKETGTVRGRKGRHQFQLLEHILDQWIYPAQTMIGIIIQTLWKE